jgi:aminoglycoside phosphotransferase (APT) family kinase protein
MPEMHRTSRDPEALRQRLESWLSARVGSDATVSDIGATTATGMSSETVLLTAAWTEDDTKHDERLVARLAPDAADVPVFPSYEMETQFNIIKLVGELTSVPVPRVRWLETTPDAIGTPFFVMDRVDGEVPPDVMPYNFGGDNWFYTASAEDQRRLQDNTVSVLAELHTLDATDERFAFLQYDVPGDTALRRHVANRRAWYDYVAASGGRSPLVEQAFDWLDEHWPSDEGDPVISWGDSRIGNAMYRDFGPVAILDWEMVGIGPRELDVSWLLYGHRVFEDIANGYGLPGMPDFLRPEDVATTYEKLTGYAPRDLQFYMAYAAVAYAIVFLRTGARSIHFGEREAPDDIDELIMNRAPLERMLAGTYWD